MYRTLLIRTAQKYPYQKPPKHRYQCNRQSSCTKSRGVTGVGCQGGQSRRFSLLPSFSPLSFPLSFVLSLSFLSLSPSHFLFPFFSSLLPSHFPPSFPFSLFFLSFPSLKITCHKNTAIPYKIEGQYARQPTKRPSTK